MCCSFVLSNLCVFKVLLLGTANFPKKWKIYERIGEFICEIRQKRFCYQMFQSSRGSVINTEILLTIVRR